MRPKRLTLEPAPKRVTFREFFYSQFPAIPPGQWAIPGEHQTEALNRFMSAAADYLDRN